MKKWMLLVISVIFSIFLISCEDDEASKIFEAQNCLDNINENLPANDLITAANACEEKLGSLDTQQANIIKCSTRFLAGGVTSSRIASALENNEGGVSANQETLVAVLSFTNYPAGEALSKSNEAFQACLRSEQRGLIFISGLSKIGTIVFANSNNACLNNGSCTTQDLESAASGLIEGCGAGGASCSPAEVGSTAIALSQSYCTPDRANDPACADVQAAIAAGGGDPAAIGAELLQQMNQP